MRYTDGRSQAVVPAFLLCMTSADDWLDMIVDKEREKTWKTCVLLNDDSKAEHSSPPVGDNNGAAC